MLRATLIYLRVVGAKANLRAIVVLTPIRVAQDYVSPNAIWTTIGIRVHYAAFALAWARASERVISRVKPWM